MVLHTWTRELQLHPHVHAIVTGGGLTADGTTWIKARRKFLFPVRVMGALFRGKMLAALECAHARGIVDLADVDLSALRRKAWVVYAKRPFGGPEQVIRYLGRYTHRVGISRGYADFNYFGISGNYRSLLQLVEEVKRVWYKWLRRRSQRPHLTWEKFGELLRRFPLPRPRIAVRIWGT
jgi:hypothetical protein